VRRVAITGIGVVSPLGNSPEALMESLAASRSGVRRLEDSAYERLTARIAAPASFNGEDFFDAPRLRMLDRFTQFALVAAQQALDRARLVFAESDRSRAGVFIGTGMGGAQTSNDGYQTLYGQNSDRVIPYSVLLAMNNAASSWIGLEHSICGPNFTYSTACSSSAVAIGEAAMRIRSGQVDTMIAGGTEAPLSLGPMRAWEALRTIATEDPDDPATSCKPFSKNRTGMVLGEGAAVFLLEEWEKAETRRAPILGEITGYGITTDIAHLTRPSVDGQARAMQFALADAGIQASSIGYVNAHGTGTQANDAVETVAIKQVFGEDTRVPVSSTKALHGHLLGAAGALEFAIAVLAMKKGMLPPTAHLAQPDAACDLDFVPNLARRAPGLRAVMSNSFAFGGTNAVLVAAAGPER
jgi:3-oxoacyl-[acyl-carrier-protein] synthase II